MNLLNKVLVILGVIILPLILISGSFYSFVYNEKFYMKNIDSKYETNVDNLINYFLDKEDLKDYTEKDKMHLIDVKSLIDKTILSFYLLLGMLFFILTYFLIYLKYKEIGFILIFGFCFFALIALLLYFVPFDALFLKFHLLSFNNDLWLLSPDESLLIRIFNQSFFMSFFYKILERAFLLGSVLFLIGAYLFKQRQTKRFNNV